MIAKSSCSPCRSIAAQVRVSLVRSRGIAGPHVGVVHRLAVVPTPRREQGRDESDDSGSCQKYDAPREGRYQVIVSNGLCGRLNAHRRNATVETIIVGHGHSGGRHGVCPVTLLTLAANNSHVLNAGEPDR